MKKRISLRKQILCAIFAAVIAILAQITIPLPFTVVPITMQVFAIILTGIILGARLGSFTVLIYILLGAVGAPVFVQFKGGFQTLIGPTGGYLIAYPITAAIIGYFSYKYKKNYLMIFLGGVLGLAVCYSIGTTQLMFVANLTPRAALMAGVIPFVPLDILKLILAIIVGTKIQSKLIKTNMLRD
ncbi:biotin transporter BioY [Clostridium vincentii]|uniref:Biotin transporter n=1 Tax=Clostridium vincentii TaxID=52704 RepID=A0A2T0BAC8_9CLOT|nr:biotin transporter BioY [Clostridium vincentii]PRR80757.1 Biotin transporter BioY [Clostridium vincentii]